MSLEKEAEEYAKEYFKNYNSVKLEKGFIDITAKDFIAGANSKYVQSEKIKA